MALLAVIGAGCDQVDEPGRQDGPPDWLTDVSAQSGLDSHHGPEPTENFFMPDIMGSGGAWFDADDDGDLDLFLVRAGDNLLYQRQADGRFRDMTAESGLGDPGYGMGAALGDMDNDGDLDLLVTNYGPNRLYRNQGDGTFVEITDGAALADDAWSTSAVFFDYDRDGFLDLYVASYLAYDPEKVCRDASGRVEFCGPQAFPGSSDLLYRNNGDGTFAKVTTEAGVFSTAGKGLGVVAADFNADGWQDVFVANDGVSNQMWINLGDGRFEDRAYAMGVAVNAMGKAEAGMGIALGDADGDLALDLFLTHLDRETNTLYTIVGTGLFSDTTAVAGVGPSSLPRTGFGTVFVDLENDGDLDLLVANGRVRRPTGAQYAAEHGLDSYAEPDSAFLNQGAGRFSDHCAVLKAFCSTRAISRGLLLGDHDEDGDLDVVVTASYGSARIFRNDAPQPGHWLVVRALDGRLQRDAIGSSVFVQVAGRWMVRPVTHTHSYLVAMEATTYFGLGDHPQADQIAVHWADGLWERFPAARAGQRLVVQRGQGTVMDAGVENER